MLLLIRFSVLESEFQLDSLVYQYIWPYVYQYIWPYVYQYIWPYVYPNQTPEIIEYRRASEKVIIVYFGTVYTDVLV
jgi:hypothetical protein